MALTYIGLALITDKVSAWWVVHCTGWGFNVAVYLVWDAYDTRRLWLFPPRLRLAIRSLTSDAMRVLLGAEGYSELVRLLGVIDRTRWKDVPENQHECSRGSRSDAVDYFPSRWVLGADYIYIYPTTRNPVDA